MTKNELKKQITDLDIPNGAHRCKACGSLCFVFIYNKEWFKPETVQMQCLACKYKTRKWHTTDAAISEWNERVKEA